MTVLAGMFTPIANVSVANSSYSKYTVSRHVATNVQYGALQDKEIRVIGDTCVSSTHT